MNSFENIELLVREISENEIVLLYFGNNTWVVCIDMKPKLEAMLKKFPKIKGVYIDPDKSIKLAAKYEVFTIPAIILYIETKETIRQARHISIKSLETRIERYYNILFN